MFSGRPWWDNEQYQSQLNDRIAQNSWYVSSNGGDCGKVIKIVYNGYKIELPDGNEKIVHPVKDRVKDLTIEKYEEAVIHFHKMKAEHESRLQAVKDEKEMKRKRQQECQHEETFEQHVVKAAGCDIYDTSCLICEKTLRRSWSTAYDKDPDDCLTDWQWWLRECIKQYGKDYVPKREDYNIVDSLDTMSR